MFIPAVTRDKGMAMDEEKEKSHSLWTVSWKTVEVLHNVDVGATKRAVVILHCTDVTAISNWHSLGSRHCMIVRDVLIWQ